MATWWSDVYDPNATGWVEHPNPPEPPMNFYQRPGYSIVYQDGNWMIAGPGPEDRVILLRDPGRFPPGCPRQCSVTEGWVGLVIKVDGEEILRLSPKALRRKMR